MKILYVALSYIPARRASSVQVMRMCSAFAAHGHDVTLLAKRGDERTPLDPFAFYGVPATFKLDLLPRPRMRGGGVVYAASVARRMFERRESDLVYSRDLIGAALGTEMRIPTVFEAHGALDTGWKQMLWRRLASRPDFRGLVTISNALARRFERDGLTPESKPVVIAPSAAEAITDAARRRTDSRPRIGYVGSLYAGRGIDMVLAIARAEPDMQFVLVGGTASDIARVRADSPPPNVELTGFVPPAELPSIYATFDVLLMPYPHSGVQGPSARLDTAEYCSPMKMFEYMGTGVPIVASDLPVLQEILEPSRNALVVGATDVAAWRDAIRRLVSDGDLGRRLAQQALDDLRQYTPLNRAARILSALCSSASSDGA